MVGIVGTGQRPLYYDINGKPYEGNKPHLQWARDKASKDSARIQQDYVFWGFGKSNVSTVWLGLDHSFDGKGPPIIFETMIFGGPINGYQWRYSTKEEALAGHKKVLYKARFSILIKLFEKIFIRD